MVVQGATVLLLLLLALQSHGQVVVEVEVGLTMPLTAHKQVLAGLAAALTVVQVEKAQVGQQLGGMERLI
jgi:hypothetical protein